MTTSLIGVGFGGGVRALGAAPYRADRRAP